MPKFITADDLYNGDNSDGVDSAVPTQPAPTQPAPTQPAPTQPASAPAQPASAPAQPVPATTPDYTAIATHINKQRAAQGYAAIPVTGTEDATLVAAYNHAKKHSYLETAPAKTANASADMAGGITNNATQTSVTTEKPDYAPVNEMLKAMQEQGMGFTQAFERFYPKPQANTANEDLIRKQQKTALFADMLRLVTEGVGASKGANVQQRDQRNPYATLQAKLAQEHTLYAKNISDWQAKGVDAAMKDVQFRADAYKNAPKVKTTVANNDWERSKFERTQKQRELEMANANKQKALDRANSTNNANISANGKTPPDPKETQLTFADNNGTAVIANNAHEGLMSAAYQALLNDPAYAGKVDAKEIEAIKNDFSFEGKKAKIRAYVEQHAHESPAAQELIKANARSYTRTSVKPQGAQSGQAVPKMYPTPAQGGAKSRLSTTAPKSRLSK